MAPMLKPGRLLARAACLSLLFAILCTMGFAQRPQEAPIAVTLAGQSMIRSDIRATAPSAVSVIRGLLNGDVVVTNFEAAVAEKVRQPRRLPLRASVATDGSPDDVELIVG